MSRNPILVCAALLMISGSEAVAADGRWYFQAGVSYLSTTDEIRSNAAIIYTQQFGDDGIPFTGDPNEKTTCSLNHGDFYPDQDPFCDLRPDDLLAREAGIDGAFSLDLAAGFLVTPRFALQLDVGWGRADAPNVDLYVEETIPVAGSNGLYGRLEDRSSSSTVATGTITRIPVSLSGILRFRTDQSLRLHAGAGVGYLITDHSAADLASLNERLDSLRIKKIGDENGAELTPGGFRDTFVEFEGLMTYEYPVSVETGDGWFWQLTGGLEYRMTPSLGIVFDARYVLASKSIVIDLEGHDQIDLVTLPDVLFRPDGSLQVYSPGANAPNPLCAHVRGPAHGCIDSTLDQRVNPEAPKAAFPEPLAGVTCPAERDFDGDGQIDSCYTKGLVAPSGRSEPVGFWVVQGGDVDLDYFSVGLALRLELPSKGREAP